MTCRPGPRLHGAWEQRISGTAYDDAPPQERPKYGALNHRNRPVGGAPRFGSAHLRLASHTLPRTTFCYPDSVFEPQSFGTATHLALTELADADYRGQHIVDLAATIAVDGRLDPALIGEAVASGAHDPQDLKRVWHHLARFGQPT